MQEFVNIKIRQINDVIATAGVFLRHESMPKPEGFVEARLGPDQIVRVPVEFQRNRTNTEITLDPPTRPVFFPTQRHADAWLFPRIAIQRGMSEARVQQLRQQVWDYMEQLGIEELRMRGLLPDPTASEPASQPAPKPEPEIEEDEVKVPAKYRKRGG